MKSVPMFASQQRAISELPLGRVQGLHRMHPAPIGFISRQCIWDASKQFFFYQKVHPGQGLSSGFPRGMFDACDVCAYIYVYAW